MTVSTLTRQQGVGFIGYKQSINFNSQHSLDRSWVIGLDELVQRKQKFAPFSVFPFILVEESI